MLERIIFAIDNDTDVRINARFLRHMDNQRALGYMHPMELCLGFYKGKLERSYMVFAKDFHYAWDFVKGQESILRVPGDTRQPCSLEFLATGERVSVGCMREVTQHEACVYEAWTYFEGKYFVCKEN